MTETTTRSVTRAFAILKRIRDVRESGLRLAAITRETGLSKTTTIRLIQTLVNEGMLVRRVDGKYILGPEAHALGRRSESHDTLNEIASNPVRRIAIACGDSAFLSVRQNMHSVCLIREDGSYPLKTHVLQPGARLPLGVGAGGMAMLAALSDETIERCLEANRSECEQHYPGDLPPQMLERVRECREKGYAINRGSVVSESWAVGAMIRDRHGQPIAALTIAAVRSRLQPEREKQLGPLLIKEAAALEKILRSPGGVQIES